MKPFDRTSFVNDRLKSRKTYSSTFYCQTHIICEASDCVQLVEKVRLIPLFNENENIKPKTD